jgi:putative aldouronate transport system substrate-binding protein
MKQRKRKGWLLPAGLALTVLAGGCTQANTNSSSSGTTANQAQLPEKKISIEYFAGLNVPNLPPKEKDQILQAINAELNIDLTMSTMATADADNKLNVRVAGGDIPDVFTLSPNQYLEYAKRGVLLDLYPYQDQLSNMPKLIGDDWDEPAIGGKLYGIKNLASMAPRYRTYWIRQDWLRTLGLKTPTTPDEFMNVAKAFTFNDPDGNGKNDTYGLTGNGMAGFAPLFGAFGVPLGTGESQKGEFYVEDGKVQNSLYAPGMKKALVYVNSLVSAGVVDPEMVGNKEAQARSSAFQGKVGIAYLPWPNVMKNEFKEQWKTVNPNADWVQLPAIKGPSGSSNNAWDVVTASRTVVSQTVAKDPEKLKRVLRLLNYMASTEGYNLVSYGIEGKHFNLVNGKVVPTELLAKEGDFFSPYQLLGRDDQSYLTIKFPELKPYIDFSFADPHKEVYTSGVVPPEGFNLSDANRFIQEALLKFIYGKESVDKYDEFLAKLEQTFKYKDFFNAAQAYLKEQGHIK